jgi:hypothetical protein
MKTRHLENNLKKYAKKTIGLSDVNSNQRIWKKTLNGGGGSRTHDPGLMNPML